MSSNTTSYPLFGGALSIDLPAGLLDASDIRQVPDTQEVFLAHDSELSYIIEILEAVESDECAGAIKFHFDSLAHDNTALSSTITSIDSPSSLSTESAVKFSDFPPSPPNQPTVVTLCGNQVVQKFGKKELEGEVVIFMAVWRIQGKNTDIVFTINCPEPSFRQAAEQAFRAAVPMFKVNDWNLFAG
ncbi:RAN guanine nucleotide release factor [Phaffia rhodozyma]|uniref:RAN guanine nucleotide release factor n=1 Tax=Phaffia rhodozyma TaxID=264483 RepID=A0A0F7SZ51_PHARH|nr:RAN guanine nucleotide release factor [Phaffia rhodozyma]